MPGSVTSKNTVRRTSRTTRRKRLPQHNRTAGGADEANEKNKKDKGVTPEVSEKQKPQQRVFLYIQLKEMLMLPKTENALELHLYHPKNTLQKMQERYTTETVIYQHEFKLDKPVFTMGVIQDDIENMNTFSDTPLMMSLYQRIPAHFKGDSESSKHKMPSGISGGSSEMIELQQGNSKSKLGKKLSKTDTSVDEGEGEENAWVEESLELLSRGHCDLLQLFQKRRFISDVTVYLYPQYHSLVEAQDNAKITTCSIWHMYSIIPILKDFNFTNLAFLTLESIYNVPEDLHTKSAELGLSLSFRSRYPEGEEGEYPVTLLCTYYGFGSQIISDQNTSIVWENLKRDLNPNKHFSFNQMETNSRIKLPRIFRMLLWEKDVDFHIDQIDPVSNLALINNSLHRFVINEDMRKILEEAVVHNDYELFLQLFYETTENVLYEGVVNPSIFGYPGVNYCRFAALMNPVVIPEAETTAKNLPPKATAKGMGPKEPVIDTSPQDTGVEMGPMFATLKICFFQPICERNEPLDKYNESLLKRAKLRRCFDIEFLNENEEEDSQHILLELYRAFDDLITDMIGFIVKRDVESIDQKRDFFCCQLGNLSNLLLKICGCDYNIRMPTKTNIEFREMLTHMYKELMVRVEGILAACTWQGTCGCGVQQEYELLTQIRQMEDMRMISQIGRRDLAIQMYEEIRHSSTNKIVFDFVTLLNSVETLQFAQAARYFQKPRSTEWSGYYFTQLLQLYVDYMMEMRSTEDEIISTAYTNLLDSLRLFASKNSLETEPWVLLYCFYQMADYFPGMEFTRWKFENLYEIPSKDLSFTPRSLYDLYLPEDFPMQPSRTVMNLHFYPVFKLFARLGAYGFAEVVFSDIDQCFTEAENYLIKTTLKILQRHIDETFRVSFFPTADPARSKLMRCYQLHINGSVEYARSHCEDALKFFEELFNLADPDNRSFFNLSFMRLAQLAFDRGRYELANEAIDVCLTISKNDKNFVANYCKALTLYHLNRLEEAIPYLSRCTEVDIYIPDVWGYLAVINLRLNMNKRALDCWIQAKMYPEMIISKSVYAELDKIKYSDVYLMVNNDGNPAEKSGKPCFTL
ncbi:hypothetical protein KR018_007885 [Drosophila ironensis]|nr:hypothetical protein KR018_007885 [Drosophila ironensis]